MKITIETSEDYLQIENADTAVATAAVRSFCTMLKSKGSIRPQPVKAEPMKKSEPVKVAEITPMNSVAATTPAVAQQPAKQTKLVSNTTGITNIKFSEGEFPIPLYLAKYECPVCADKGTRFSGETNKYLKCRSCDSQLVLEKTMPGAEFMESDEDGYFFKANKKMGYHNNLGVKR